MPGLTPEGFVIKTLDEIQQGISAKLKQNIDPNLDTEVESPLGQCIGVFSEEARQLWELGQEVYSSQFKDSASGFALASGCALTGTIKKGATQSRAVGCTINLDDGVSFEIGELIAHVSGDSTARFYNATAVANDTGETADFSVDFLSEETGPVRANSGTLSVIAETVVGWNSVTNPEDAILGEFVEEDNALRLRQAEELSGQGSTTPDAIQAKIGKIPGVLSARVFENVFDTTDAEGRPPHCIEAIVLGGDEEEIALTILGTKAGGIQTYGAGTVVEKTVTDSQGNPKLIKFSRPTDVDVYIEIDLTVDTTNYGGDEAVKKAIVDYGDTNYKGGSTVVLSALSGEVFKKVSGILDVVEIRAGLAPSPSGTSNLPMGVRDLADLDTSRVLVNLL